jgi:hypothetical protein
VARREIADGCLIDLHVALAEHASLDLLVNGLEPLRGQFDPFGHGLARQPDLVARPVDRLLAVERKMIAILTHHDLRQESGRNQAAWQERIGQWSHDGHGIHRAALHIRWAHRAPAQEAGGLIVEPLADFLTDAAPLRWS